MRARVAVRGMANWRERELHSSLGAQASSGYRILTDLLQSRRSEEILEPEFHALRNLSYSPAARCEPAPTGARRAERHTMRRVLGESHGGREPRGLDGITQAANVLRRKS